MLVLFNSRGITWRAVSVEDVLLIGLSALVLAPAPGLHGVLDPVVHRTRHRPFLLGGERGAAATVAVVGGVQVVGGADSWSVRKELVLTMLPSVSGEHVRGVGGTGNDIDANFPVILEAGPLPSLLTQSGLMREELQSGPAWPPRL